MRSLTIEEIEVMERQGCTADDWGDISVAEDFSPQQVREVDFHGEVALGVFDEWVEVTEGLRLPAGLKKLTLCNVSIGDNCLIERVNGYLSNYDIGDHCYLSGIGTMTTTTGTTFGQGNVIAVMNEAGEGNVVSYDGLSSQMAALMVHCAKDETVWPQLRRMAVAHATSQLPRRGVVGRGAKIVNVREIVNTLIGDDCEVNGASRLCDCSLCNTSETGCFVGHDVICENSVISAGASIVDGARVDNCFVGEACHLGKGFSAESSIFFANSYMDNGEACAAFCGPFSVSHHKASLLIGMQCAFYNAGSATNFSNHAYKLGPVHHGQMERGSKTASGAHLLLPAKVGAFSVCLGKITQHPDSHALPFSYLIGENGTTYIVPGRNLVTVGTWRDVNKWPKRDRRPKQGRKSIVNFDWLNPMVIREVVEGRETLLALRREQGGGAASYTFGNCLIKNSALQKGINYYELALRLYVGMAVRHHRNELPESSVGTGEWVDMAGLLAPLSEVEQVVEDLRCGQLGMIDEIEEQLALIHSCYDQYKWNATYRMVLNHLDVDRLTEDDLQRVDDDYQTALREWKSALRYDAEREFALGDVEEHLLNSFLSELERME